MDQRFRQHRQVAILAGELAVTKDIGYCSLSIGQLAWGQNETELFSTDDCFDTCRIAYMHCGRGRHGAIAGREGRRQTILSVFAGQREGRMHQGLQGLCGCKWPFGLCDDLLLARRRPLYHLRFGAERSVTKGRGRPGAAILPGGLEEVEGQDRERRLRDRGFEVTRRLPNWRRPRQNREAPCSARS